MACLFFALVRYPILQSQLQQRQQMAQTFAEKMVAKYEELLEANAGLASVNVDGQQVSYSDLEAKYGHWLKKVAQ